MKKIIYLASVLAATPMFLAQSLIVGKNQISVQDFKKQYKYGLENSGIDKTVNSTIEFMLLQQLAQEKKADTMTFFKNALGLRYNELKQNKLYPKSIIDPLVADYIKDSQTEKKIQVFSMMKAPGQTENYTQIYNDVIGGKLTIEEAVEKYSKDAIPPMYVKAGTIDNELYLDILKTSVGGYTKLVDTPVAVYFAKVIDTRPTLGYISFGSISYPNDFNEEDSKNKIYNALKSGKKFEEVAKLYGSTEHEKNSGGLVMGSPILPDEVYAALKDKPKGYYTTSPILIDKKFFIFNIYHIEPYKLLPENTDFFTKEMMASTYGDMAYNRLIKGLKVAPDYKETADFATIKKSYQAFQAFKNENATLFQYKEKGLKFSELKEQIQKNFKELDKIFPREWSDLMDNVSNSFVFANYNADFVKRDDVKPELEEAQRNLYSEYIFSHYLKNEISNHPEKQKAYYEQHKSNYMWEKRADSRVAVISDEKLVKEVQKEISNPKNWADLKKKYDKKLNDKGQILVSFEQGKVPETADIFAVNKLAFKKGVSNTKIKERFVVLAVDDILPEEVMTYEEAKDMVKEDYTDQVLKDTVASQKAKIKVEVQPGFIEELSKNFKK